MLHALRHRLKVILLIPMLGLACCSMLAAALKPDIKIIETKYAEGSFPEARQSISKAIPETDEEKALVLFYKAILATDAIQTRKFLEQLTDEYPKTPYAQKAYLELSHLLILDRDYKAAIQILKKVTDASLTEKHFWLAQAYYQLADYKNAISSGEQYLRSVKSGNKAEILLYLQADAYINLSQYNSAINTLKKVETNPQLDSQRQYLYYRLGYAYEMLFKHKEALNYYKLGIELNRYSQLAYQMEDRLFDLKARYPNSIDLCFLYPFSDSPLPEIVQADIDAALKAEADSLGNKVQVPFPAADSMRTDAGQPQSGIFLQAGRFSRETNAAALTDKIARLGFRSRYYRTTSTADVSFVVLCGPFTTMLEAQDAKDNLRLNSIDSFIIQR